DIPFRTANPARITQASGRYTLAPTRIDFGRGPSAGAARLAATYGGGVTTAQVRLDRTSLSILSAFVPSLGVTGAAS
ncbi:hypothetical protein, partial [Clostridium perfringens]